MLKFSDAPESHPDRSIHDAASRPAAARCGAAPPWLRQQPRAPHSMSVPATHRTTDPTMLGRSPLRARAVPRGVARSAEHKRRHAVPRGESVGFEGESAPPTLARAGRERGLTALASREPMAFIPRASADASAASTMRCAWFASRL